MTEPDRPTPWPRTWPPFWRAVLHVAIAAAIANFLYTLLTMLSMYIPAWLTSWRSPQLPLMLLRWSRIAAGLVLPALIVGLLSRISGRSLVALLLAFSLGAVAIRLPSYMLGPTRCQEAYLLIVLAMAVVWPGIIAWAFASIRGQVSPRRAVIASLIAAALIFSAGLWVRAFVSTLSHMPNWLGSDRSYFNFFLCVSSGAHHVLAVAIAGRLLIWAGEAGESTQDMGSPERCRSGDSPATNG